MIASLYQINPITRRITNVIIIHVDSCIKTKYPRGDIYNYYKKNISEKNEIGTRIH